jgi:hypothetical protein
MGCIGGYYLYGFFMAAEYSSSSSSDIVPILQVGHFLVGRLFKHKLQVTIFVAHNSSPPKPWTGT